MLHRLRTASALAALLLLPALLRADDPPTGDKDLDGTWEAVSNAVDGKEQPLPPDGKLLVTISGGSLTLKADVGSHMATIGVDASKTPKTIDITPQDGADKGRTALGIYEVKGDELRLCGADAGKDRPTELTSKPGSGWIFLTLKRVKK
ncbi:MAG TPA: TIGR03067 domain-containing protein [Gemmataceae bacterium]|nr:TIGR03067 domain-containing protein [Gemmataceae bacterium]